MDQPRGRLQREKLAHHMERQGQAGRDRVTEEQNLKKAEALREQLSPWENARASHSTKTPEQLIAETDFCSKNGKE